MVHGLLVVAAARSGLFGQLGRGCERPVAVDADREQQLHGSREGEVLGVIGPNRFHGAEASPIVARVVTSTGFECLTHADMGI